jgi:hypothetical protein
MRTIRYRYAVFSSFNQIAWRLFPVKSKHTTMINSNLSVRALNEGALGLYHDLGYRTVGESRFYARWVV